MLEILKFLFKDFWHWLGATFWIAIIAQGISSRVIEISQKNKKDTKESEEHNQ